MKKTIIALASTLILAPSLVLAGNGHDNNRQASIQYNGPVETTSVSELLQDTSMFTEMDVVIDGTIIRQLKNDKFVFSDGNAEIQIELDDIRLTTPLDANTKVRIFGEYEGGNTPEIEVDHIQIM